MKSIKGFILYLDVLGYKNIVGNCTAEQDEKIKKLLDDFIDVYEKSDLHLVFGEKRKKKNILTRGFSDNFLYVCESDSENTGDLLAMAAFASMLQWQFLLCGLLTRGSLTYGEIFYNDELVYGPALIKAVGLEAGHSEPSVVINPDLKKIPDVTDEDGKICRLFPVGKNDKASLEVIVNGIEKCLCYFNLTKEDTSAISKIKWLVGKVNEYFHLEDNEKYDLINNLELKKGERLQ